MYVDLINFCWKDQYNLSYILYNVRMTMHSN